MSAFNLVAILIVTAALLSFINHRFVKLPPTIGLMVSALAISMSLIGLDYAGVNISDRAAGFIQSVDFGEALMKIMLSFLLFAGAIKINLDDLREQKFVVSGLASFGVIISTFLIGTATYYVLRLFSLELPYTYCLVFGALISPTDPVAVLSILKSVRAPKTLETKIAGESLFNDGVGVVVFLILVEVATGTGDVSAGHVGMLFLQEAVGGVLFGLLLGWLAYRLLKSVDEYTVEVLITLALVFGGYALATAIHTSGPIATVVAGLLIGNHGRSFAMSDKTREHLDNFWELIDEILNAVLFVWIGLEILVLSYSLDRFLIGLIAIPVTLASRYISVSALVTLLKFRREFSPNVIMILTWGGIRGGISIALALSLPTGTARDLIVSITYVVVIFSILVQGLTIGKLIRSTIPKA